MLWTQNNNLFSPKYVSISFADVSGKGIFVATIANLQQ
jgi:hypothetical protein